MKLIYSQTHHAAEEGHERRNPRFFAGPEEGAKEVLIVGDWPNIVKAYEAADVAVRRVDPLPPKPAPLAPPERPSLDEQERDAVQIPHDWRDLPYNKAEEGRDVTLRSLAVSFTDETVINKAQAVAAIEAELERRGVAE